MLSSKNIENRLRLDNVTEFKGHNFFWDTV